MAEHQSAAGATGRPMPDRGHFAGIPLERCPHSPTEKEGAAQRRRVDFEGLSSKALRPNVPCSRPVLVVRVATQRNSGARSTNALISFVRPFQKNIAINGPTSKRAITLGEKPE